MECILASTSPRRKELLKLIISEFTTVDSMVEEGEYPKLSARQKALQLSRDKCRGAMALVGTRDKLIIASDTVVDVGGTILGKPQNKQQAYAMIKRLSGTNHKVHSGVSVCYKGVIFSFTQTTKVYFDRIDDKTICEYIDTQEPYDKAGGYAIQGFMAGYIEKIVGNYHNVVGLPVQKLNKLLKTIKAI
ncbi:MAG: Maf family protein [Oscillospiraceae bacterium]